jgi:hypothetical protein
MKNVEFKKGKKYCFCRSINILYACNPFVNMFSSYSEQICYGMHVFAEKMNEEEEE